ncbi:MAG: HEAT repeat domain-containing protein [bacterium]
MRPKQHLEKLIPLYVYEELEEDEKKEVEVHIEYCEACRQQLEELRALHNTLDQKIILQPTDELLARSRSELRDRLRAERIAALKESWWERISEFFLEKTLAFQLVGAAVILLLGIFMGRFLFSPKERSEPLSTEFLSGTYPRMISQPLITNVDLVQYNPQTGEVTVRYKSVNDVSLRGGIDEEPIRRVLVHAIRSEEHPGHRLTAVKAFGERTSSNDEIEDVLIYAMKNDAVDGVRLRAAKVLKALPFSSKIKEAFIRVLLKDSNPAIRIEAVDALSKVKEKEDVAPIFQDVAKDDENDFVRLKASRALEGRDNSKFDQK